jgi:Uma2 family endonuclease
LLIGFAVTLRASNLQSPRAATDRACKAAGPVHSGILLLVRAAAQGFSFSDNARACAILHQEGIKNGEVIMARQPKTYLSVEEYLALERNAEDKHEYHNGEMVAMTGASREHNIIVTNIVREFSLQLKGKPCEVYPNDMRVKIPSSNRYVYPDTVVVCGEPQFEDAYVDTLLNPTLIVEVLSGSTEVYDRFTKAGYYRKIASLAEYLLIAQDSYSIEQCTRQPDGRWLITDADSLEAVIKLSSIGCELALKEVYDRIKLS